MVELPFLFVVEIERVEREVQKKNNGCTLDIYVTGDMSSSGLFCIVIVVIEKTPRFVIGSLPHSCSSEGEMTYQSYQSQQYNGSRNVGRYFTCWWRRW